MLDGLIEPVVLLIGIERHDRLMMTPRQILPTSGDLEAGGNVYHVHKRLGLVSRELPGAAVLLSKLCVAVPNPVPNPPRTTAIDQAQSLSSATPLGKVQLSPWDPSDTGGRRRIRPARQSTGGHGGCGGVGHRLQIIAFVAFNGLINVLIFARKMMQVAFWALHTFAPADAITASRPCTKTVDRLYNAWHGFLASAM